MKRFYLPALLLSFALGAAVALSVASMAGVGGPLTPARAKGTLHVVEHAVTDTVVDVGKKGDSLGDDLAFGNPVYDAANKKQVGRDQGHCVRTVAGKSWECFWSLLLPAGQITVEGPFYDAADSTLTVTGGTGAYRGAHGQMALHARNARGTEYDFTYDLD